MKIKEVFTVIGKETKTGTSAKGDYSIDEYSILNRLETETGSIVESILIANTTEKVGALDVGDDYNLTLFVSSREHEGKNYPTFRITFAEKIKSESKKVKEDIIGDDIPF